MTDRAMTGTELGEKLLASVRQMKAGRAARTTQVAPVAPSAAALARGAIGCTQAEFASLLGVSLRTLQEWEQGRRQPTGAALALIKVARYAPNVVREATI